MAYEFTKQKLAAEKKSRIGRLMVSGLAACAGFALGFATNDMHNLFGIFAACTLAVISGLAVYYSMT